MPGPPGRCGMPSWYSASSPGFPPPRNSSEWPRCRRPARSPPGGRHCQQRRSGPPRRTSRSPARPRTPPWPAERRPRPMAPGRVADSRSPRAVANRIPSSRLNTPAAWAAANSPTLCPRTTAGPDPHAGPEGRLGAFQCVQSRLLPGSVAQVSLRPRSTEHHIQEGDASLRPEHRLAPVEHRPCHRLALIEIPSHADPLDSPDRCRRTPPCSPPAPPVPRRPEPRSRDPPSRTPRH